MKYRSDIDGLRAIAVIPVIIFHLGFLSNGYLGVDVFFVISGYLITSIIYKEVIGNKFSILKFYERRIRRIIPLLLVISLVAFILGLLLMLPDDLENLCQSIVASNFSANNILMLFTSADYWAVKNEYKPLMHTWSLGIEEQFYLVYPFIFLMFSKINISYIKPILGVLTIGSLLLFLFGGSTASKFYLIQYRFFELSIGGLAAIHFYHIRSIKEQSKYLLYIATILLILMFVFPIGTNTQKVISVTILTTLILTLGKYFEQNDQFIKYIFQNKIFIFIGKISFSLYMWHQLIFAFVRYAFVEEIDVKSGLLLSLLTFVMSLVTYYLVENTFRNRAKFKTKYVLLTVGALFAISTFSSFYVYTIGGIHKDFPSINMYKSDNASRGSNLLKRGQNIHVKYNEDVRKLDKGFENTSKEKVLVIGSSVGRDVVNIFQESEVANQVSISYFEMKNISYSKIKKALEDKDFIQRMEEADLIFIAANKFIGNKWLDDIKNQDKLDINTNKIYCFGTKDFGYSNGIHYNRMNEITDFTNYYTHMKKGVPEREIKLKEQWGDRYLSLIEPIKNSHNEVLVFTPKGKFISQDTIHLTKGGAQFYATFFNDLFNRLIKEIKTSNY